MFSKQIETFWRQHGDDETMIMLDKFPGIQGAHWIFDQYETLELSILQENINQVKRKIHYSFLSDLLNDNPDKSKIKQWEELIDNCEYHEESLYESINLEHL